MRTFASLLAVIAASATASASASTVSLSIRASSDKVLYGHTQHLSGRLSTGMAGRPVAIYSKPYGLATIRIATVTTGHDGRWSLEVRPAIESTYVARAGTTSSRLVSIGVRPAIATRMSNGGIAAHVSGGTFSGRLIELQRAHGKTWQTIAQAALNRESNAFFRAPLAGGTATFRVAMSVNQAGAGYLGTASHPFLFHGATISLTATALKIRYGSEVALGGRISTGQAGQQVTILARRYGTPAPEKLATVLTGVGGRWVHLAKPRIGTTYTAMWNGLASRAIAVGVRPTLLVDRLTSGKLAVRAEPAKLFVGRNVELQRRLAGHWRTIEQTPLAGPQGQAVMAVPYKTGRAMLRVAMSVNEAGAGYLAALTSPIDYQASSVSITPTSYKVLSGHWLTMTGSISPARTGQKVEVLAWSYGRSAPIDLGSASTDRSGTWAFRVKPSLRTSYTAVWGSHKSRTVAIGVEPRMTVRVLGNGRIVAHVASSKHLFGRMVQLQQLTPAHEWTTIGKMRLDRSANAVFGAPTVGASLSADGTTLRVAMSVNQAGAGLLGASSHAFIYHSV